MKYSNHSLKQKSKRKFITDWSFKEGVFETPQGDFIARIKKKNKNLYETISRHKTYDEAKSAFDFAKQFHTTQIRSMTRRDILEKHWKNYLISIGMSYRPMSDKAYEEMEKAMEEYAALRQSTVILSNCCNSELVNFNKDYDQCFVCEKIQKKQTAA